MIFSYIVDGEYVIKSASLKLEKGYPCLLTGGDNSTLTIIGGIIAKLIPIQEKLPWPPLQALIKNYTGELVIGEGSLPGSSAYISIRNIINRHISQLTLL